MVIGWILYCLCAHFFSPNRNINRCNFDLVKWHRCLFLQQLSWEWLEGIATILACWSLEPEMWDEITSPFPNFNCATIEVCEWISNFIPHFIMDVITNPCWDQSSSMLVKRSLGVPLCIRFSLLWGVKSSLKAYLALTGQLLGMPQCRAVCLYPVDPSSNS